jgi:predicted TIM-barrel fold metal-dependent hydrolase
MMRKAFKTGVIMALLLVAAALLARWVLFKSPVQFPQALPNSPFIDMHVHIAGLGYGDSGCFVADVMKDSYKFDYYLGAFGVNEALLKQHGDQVLVKRLAQTIDEAVNIDGAVILALDGVMNEQGELDRDKIQVYIPNDYVAEQARLYPNIYFGASINPYQQDALARLEEAKEQGAKLMKWIPNIQHIDPNDNRITDFYLKMKALDLPLLSHAGQERSFADAIDEYGDPKRLVLPLLLAEPRLQSRLVYGSDFPLVNMELVPPYYFPLNLTV